MKKSTKEPDWSWTTPAGRVRANRRALLISEGAGLLLNIAENYPDWKLGEKSYMSVMEIGCGTGWLTRRLEDLGVFLVAIDADEEMVEVTKEKVLSEYTIIELRDIEDLTPKPLFFDAVAGSSVLHHINIPESLRKIYTLLKHGGHISFAEPNLLNPQVWIERRWRRFFWYVSPRETAFTRWFIRDRLKEAGFVDVKVAPFDWLHPLTPRALIPLVSWLGKWLERIPVVREFAGSLIITGRKP